MNIIGYFNEVKWRELEEKTLNTTYIKFFRPEDHVIGSKSIEKLKNIELIGNTTLHIVNSSTVGRIFYKSLEEKFNVVYEDFCTWHGYESILGLKRANQSFKPTNPQKNFCSLNHRPRIKRCAFMDALEKHNLINDNYVSWQGYETKYPFKYFDNRKITFDNVFESDQHLNKIPFDMHVPPEEAFKNSLWSVVCEYMMDEGEDNTYTLTEKTMVPIAHQKPLIIFGSENIYKNYLDLGFELYDEVIDYSFSEITEFENRLEMFMEQVKRLNIMDDELLRPKALRNYNNLVRLVNNKIMSRNNKKLSQENLDEIKTLLLSRESNKDIDHQNVAKK